MAGQWHMPLLNHFASGVKKALSAPTSYLHYRATVSNINSYKKHILLTFHFYILK